MKMATQTQPEKVGSILQRTEGGQLVAEPITKGLCQCGCGEKTHLATLNSRRRGQVKGEPSRFLPGHRRRTLAPTRRISSEGYVLIRRSDLSRYPSGELRYQFEHDALVERILGHPLPAGAEIHHVDENRTNNAPSNLVVCQSTAYHQLLHRRTRALRACGNPNWLKCWICKRWDDPSLLYATPSGRSASHADCRRARRETQRSLS